MKNKHQQKSLKSQNKVTTDDTTFTAGTLTWQNPVHSWKAGPGEVMTVKNKQTKMYLITALSPSNYILTESNAQKL